MNVDLTRKIDYWIGIPFCFIFSILFKIKSRFVPLSSRETIHRVIFLQISEMGSAVSAYPSVRYVKERFSEVQIYYVIFEKLQEIIDLLGIIDKKNILTIREDNIFNFVVDTLSLIIKLRKLKIDAVIDLELFSRFSSLLSYLSGARVIVGFNKFKMEGLYRGDFQTHKVVYNCYQHISYNYLSLVSSLELEPGEIPLLKKQIDQYNIKIPLITSTDKDKKRILNRLKAINPNIDINKKIIIVNPNASQLLPLRKWPLNYYTDLVKKILNELDVTVVITGLKSEKADAEAILRAVNNPRCVDFTGKTNLRELIDLFNISKILISNDSGPPNFASLTKLNIFVFFGPETPVLYRPLGSNVKVFYSNFACSPCVSAFNHRQSPCKDNKCLQAISPADVFIAVKKAVK